MLFSENLVVFNVFYVNLGSFVDWMEAHLSAHLSAHSEYAKLECKIIFSACAKFFPFLSLTSLTFPLFNL